MNADDAAVRAQIAFEVNSMLAGANMTFLLQGHPASLDRARSGVEVVLAGHGARA